MSLTPWLPTVRKIKDGEPVDQGTVNVPIDQLTQRDQHLYEKFEEMAEKSVLISLNQHIHPDERAHILPNELNLVYFRSDNNGDGISRSITGFSASQSSSMFTPKNSNYIFGLVKEVYPDTNTADLYTEGLCELSVDLDHATLGLLQPGEVFSPGPYFLSPKTLGKITRDPAGIPVYVGYAITKRQFLLHTSVEEFSQFFINYRYHVLDRVAGTPVLTNDTWTIANSNTSVVGWVAADSVAELAAPSGALFYYNIPVAAADVSSDAALESYEKLEALDLRRDLPPVPANFIQLYVNGTLGRYKDSFDPAGTYSVNEYGLWWHKNTNGDQPWSSSYPQTDSINSWAAIKTNLSASRKNIFVSFSKFNPALRTQLVRSLVPYDQQTAGVYTNRPSNFIKFYDKENIGQTSPTGDLLFDIIANISAKGYSDNAGFQYPADIDNTYTAGTAVAAIKYSKALGEFEAAITPVVAKIVEGSGVTITEQQEGKGVFQITATQGLSGQVDSIEPINSRLEFKELMSYIKLPAPSTTPYGLIGKIVLPRGYSSNRAIRLVFHLFGDSGFLSSATGRNIAFQFQYSAVSASNGQSPTAYTVVNTSKYSPEINPVEFPIKAIGDYSAFTSIKITHTDLVIPAEFISEDCVVNFKILRVATADVNTSYAGNVGLIATYWEMLPNQ